MKKKKVLALQAQNVKQMSKIIKKLPLFMKMMINSETCGHVKPKLPERDWEQVCKSILEDLNVGHGSGTYTLPSSVNADRSHQYLNFVRSRNGENTSDGTSVLAVAAILMNEVRLAKEAYPCEPEALEAYDDLLIGCQHLLDAIVGLGVGL